MYWTIISHHDVAVNMEPSTCQKFYVLRSITRQHTYIFIAPGPKTRFPEGGYPPSGGVLRMSAGYPPGIRRISALRKTGFGGSCSSTKARAQNVHFSRCIQKSFMCSELYISLILCCPSTSPPTTTTPPHPVKILLLLPSLVYVFCGELFHFNWW